MTWRSAKTESRNAQLTPAQAAARLGISAKALRVYERQGLLAPGRTGAGWRVYAPDQMARAQEIVALRALGFGLAEVRQALAEKPAEIGTALASRETALRLQAAAVEAALAKWRGQPDDVGGMCNAKEPSVGFALPWPWDGDWFDQGPVAQLTFLTGPLGSGKTRFAESLAAAWPGAAFIGLDRAVAVPADGDRTARALSWLVAHGATPSVALDALLCAIEALPGRPLIVDLIEHGLDEATQEAVVAWLRASAATRAPIVAMTRSTAILDLAALGRDEAVIVCPANHAPPIHVGRHSGSVGYEAAMTCLGTPAARARVAA